MKFFHITAGIVALAGWLCFADAQTGQAPNGLNQEVEGFQVNERSLSAILRLGNLSEVPLGVILADESLCTDKIEVEAPKESFTLLMHKIIGQTPGYQWLVQDGVAIIEPKSMPVDTVNLLELVIPRYAAPESTLQALAAFLRTDVLGVLRPNRGSIADILSSSSEVRTGPIEMRHATVQQILNRMVREGHGGAWVLLPTPKDYSAAADRQFVQVVSYPDSEGRIGRTSCQPQYSRTSSR